MLKDCRPNAHTHGANDREQLVRIKNKTIVLYGEMNVETFQSPLLAFCFLRRNAP